VLFRSLGAGSKAGLVPLHVWLPLAHPAAPSHVSALMSGVMTKVALYGLVRIIFDLAGPPLWWWGAVLLVVGGASAVIGVLSALLARDLKTLLAYSTVENIGIVVLGLGLALAFRSVGMVEHAALPFVAALFHALNHALFKSLLFCGAGAVLAATHERDAERLGGLIHRMPLTAIFVLTGSAAIAGLPPLNGFVSEWMIFQGVFASSGLPHTLMRIVVPVSGALLALAAALAAACFVRFYGAVFLGRPRTAAAARATEVGMAMRTAMALLALLCLLLGVMPAVPLTLIDPVALAMTGAGLPPRAVHWLWLAPVVGEASSYAGLMVLLAMALFGWIVVWIAHRLGTNRTRRAAAWDCGTPSRDPATQHSAAAIAQPIRRAFATTLFGAAERVEMPDPGATTTARLQVTLIDPAWRYIFDPVGRYVAALAVRVNALQFMTIRLYLTWMFGALVLLLLVVGTRA
jgi:formate hydrogenlyase subunit 3/multisubunit Na+/H+ antiporter MnhD subunit